ncbi:MAG: sugar phosphate nucleotidyltransferase, partial [Flavobacteriaceae bacterium]
MTENNHNYALIMAGGVGSRFWPTSREVFPKQFKDLSGTGRTLLQQTIDRLEGVIPIEQVYILTNERYSSLVKEQLPGLSTDQIICEPVIRNTAPCILYAALKIHHKDSLANMLVLP